jgi:hypothetical protein
MSPEEAKQKYEEALAALPSEVREVFLRLQAGAKPRPQLASLTSSALGALPPDDLEVAVLGFVERQLAQSQDRVAALGELPRRLQVFYLSFLVEAEVMNGGFNQFFWNSSSEFAALVGPALRELGASEAAELFDQALSQAHDEAEQARPANRPRTLQTFSESYQHTGLNAFDEAFSRHAEGFPALRLQLAQRDPPAFCGEV